MVIRIITFILGLFSPIVLLVGGITFLMYAVGEGDVELLIYSGIAFVGGIVFGIFAYKNDIPPRFFWSKSKNEIFEFSVSSILGYGIYFGLLPSAIYFISQIVEGL